MRFYVPEYMLENIVIVDLYEYTGYILYDSVGGYVDTPKFVIMKA
jgi:hypothetical protein